jgi:electron transport complex protein RnfB
MNTDVYQKLARRLDETPNGFTPTSSGVELRLLAKIFTPAEAQLASVMTLHAEPFADIAARAGVEAAAAHRTLKDMASKGLVRFRRRDKQLVFALEPFIVGFYEEQLPRMDEELATLFEQYYLESGGGVAPVTPAMHRIIPVREAIPHAIVIFPYEQASQILESAKAWGVRDCICRVQQHLVGKGCNRPVEACLTIAPVEGAFDHSRTDRAISLEEALRILHQTEEAGLIHSTGNYIDGVNYICNCCTCCCGVMRALVAFDLPTAVARSDFYTVVDEELCIACGDCVLRCQFSALSLGDNMATIDYARCMGCGLCASSCLEGALHLERRPAGETMPTPENIHAWRAQRLENRARLP